MTSSGPAEGFLLVDKEMGWTSHDVVAKIRGVLGGKVGHAGTLDPMATGLLVLGLGRSTRLLRFVQGFEKEYIATALFGVATDTLDADGAVMTRSPLPVEQEDVDAVLARFTGDILQVPPMVSARKVEGRRLYALAREGKEIEREARPVHISRLEIVGFAGSQYPEVTLRVACSTGTYVRTLADDMARALGGRAHLTALRRVRNGLLSVDAARSVGTLSEIAATGRIDELVIAPAIALAEIPGVTIDAGQETAVRNGASVPVEALGAPEATLVRLLGGDGGLLGVYRVDGPVARAEVVTA
jgi:tRNA pseudouridine55 synthase